MKQILFITFALITTHPAHAQEAHQRPPGTVTAEVYDPDYVKKFCKGKTKVQCESPLRQTFYMRLHQRYPRASLDYMTKYVDAYPVESEENPYFVEYEFIRQHNGALAKDVQAEEQRKLAEDKARSNQFWGGVTAGLSAAGASLNAPAPASQQAPLMPVYRPKKRIDCTTFGNNTECVER